MAVNGTNSGRKPNNNQQDQREDIRDESPSDHNRDRSTDDNAERRHDDNSLTISRTRFGNGGARRDRRGGSRGKVSLAASRTFQLDTGGSGTTTTLFKGMHEVLEEQQKTNANAKNYRLTSISRAKYQVPFDTIAVSRQYEADGKAYTFAHLIIVGPSRQELAPTQYEVDGFDTVSLPTVVSDNPTEKGTPYIDQIRRKIKDNSIEIFGCKAENLGFVADRVIEQQFTISEGDLKTFTELLSDAAELMESHVNNFLYNTTYDWSSPDIITDDNGCAVSVSVDYNPPPLFSATGMPIHRQMILMISCFERGDLGKHTLEKVPLVDVSVYLDLNRADPDSLDRNEKPLYPQIIISHLHYHTGGNQLELLMLAVANLTRMKDNFQYLPGWDFRKIKLDPQNSLGNLGNIFADELDLSEAGQVAVTDINAMTEISNRLFSDTIEIAIDCSATNPSTGAWQDFLISCRKSDSESRAVILEVLDSMAPGTSDDVDKYDDSEIIIPDTVPIVGGFINDVDQTGATVKFDCRRYNTLLAAASIKSDPDEATRALTNAKDGLTFEPPISVDNQLQAIHDVTGRQPTVTTYWHRIHFSPDLLVPVYENFKKAGLVGNIENSRSGSRRRLQNGDELRSRGIEARSGRRGSRRRDRDDDRRSRRV